MLEIRDVAKAHHGPEGRVEVLRGVDLDLARGERVALMGESGSGKSTLLHLIGALDAADRGSIRLDGRQITGLGDRDRAALRRERIGFVFQQFNLVPALRVDANLSLQARLAGREDPAWTTELAARLGLAGLLSRYPEQLSGGQQQRVAVGRALAARPDVLLADEPTGALDEETSDEVMGLIQDLVSRTGCAFLMATHSERLAGALDRRLKLNAGRIV